MHGIEIAETDHRVVVTFDTDVIDRHRIERALNLLEFDEPDYSHIPDADPEEQAEIVLGLLSMTPEEKEYTLVRRRNDL
jgi:hypothetical protein